VTRGKRLVVLVGQKKAVAIAVRNASSTRRWSKLDEWLRLAASSGFAYEAISDGREAATRSPPRSSEGKVDSEMHFEVGAMRQNADLRRMLRLRHDDEARGVDFR
jgi:hypothetical protein